jgi:transcriptional regulator with XRE-family HTH domain
MESPEHLHAAFGKTLRLYREKAGLTQAALAESASASTSYIGYLEAGKRMPTLATFITLAAVLQVDPNEFLGETLRLMHALQEHDKTR